MRNKVQKLLTFLLLLTSSQIHSQYLKTFKLLDSTSILNEGRILNINSVDRQVLVGTNIFTPSIPSFFYSGYTTQLTSLDLNGNTIFNKRYFFGDLTSQGAVGSNKGQSIERGFNSDIVVVGQHSRLASYYGPTYFTRVDANTGNPLSVKSIQYDSINESDDIAYRVKRFDNYFYIVGSTKKTIGANFSNGTEQLLLMKISPIGNVVWVNAYDPFNSNMEERNTIGYDFQIIDDKIYIVGKSRGISNGSVNQNHDNAFLSVIDTAGAPISFTLFDYFGENSSFNAIDIDTKRNSLLVGGHAEFFIAKNLYLTASIDISTGSVNWCHLFDCPWLPGFVGQVNATCSSISYDTNNDLIYSTGFMNEDSNMFPTLNTDIVTFILDGSGNPQSLYRSNSINNDYAKSIVFHNNEFFLYGFTQEYSPVYEAFGIRTLSQFTDICSFNEELPVVEPIVLNQTGCSVNRSPNYTVYDLDYLAVDIDEYLECGQLNIQNRIDNNPSPYTINLNNLKYLLVPDDNAQNIVQSSINTEFVELKIYDIRGVQIQAEYTINDREINILTKLQSGIYIFLYTTNEGTVYSKKISIINHGK